MGCAVLRGDFIMTELEVVKKKGVREATGDFNVSSGVYEKVDERVRELLSKAVERAEADNRVTVKARDV